MIFLCQGLVKSASSFAYHLASGIAEAAGHPQLPLCEQYIPGHLVPFSPQPYFVELSEGALGELADAVPADDFLVIKLHGSLFEDVVELLESGRCRGVCTYRDPRDVVVSLYEASQRERRKTVEIRRSAFTSHEDVEHCVATVAARLEEVMPWLRASGILAIDYEELRRDPLGAAERIREQMGLSADVMEVAIRYLADKRRIREFNVGTSGRYRTVLSTTQETAANAAFSSFLRSMSAL